MKLEKFTRIFALASKNKYAAGILFHCPEDSTVLLVHRSSIMNNPNLWDLPGGRNDKEDDDKEETAKREAHEELGELPKEMRLIKDLSIEKKDEDHIYKKYHVFIYSISKEEKKVWTPKIKLDKENDKYKWFDVDKVPVDTRIDLSWIPLEVGVQKNAALKKYAEQTFLPRVENKYYVTAEVADEIRDFISSFVNDDEHGRKYAIHNIYWDTEDLILYGQQFNHAPDRYKLRVRTYDQDKNAFLEIKRKDHGFIKKQRTVVDSRRYLEALRDEVPFVKAAKAIHAHPVMLIDYDREAYDLNDGCGRITFDSNIKYQQINSKQENILLPSNVYLLELKYNGKMPFMMATLEKVFNLNKVGFSKYFDSISELALRGKIFPKSVYGV